MEGVVRLVGTGLLIGALAGGCGSPQEAADGPALTSADDPMAAVKKMRASAERTEYDGATGRYLGYYADGAPAYRIGWDGERLDGELVGWYEDGSRMIEGRFRRGKPDGWFRLWDARGELMTACLWHDGVPVSTEPAGGARPVSAADR